VSACREGSVVNAGSFVVAALAIWGVTSKAEDLHGRRFDNDEQLRQALRSYIAFHNQQRLHSALRYLPPVAFERQQGLQPCVN
jgi:transposase InsO family protein